MKDIKYINYGVIDNEEFRVMRLMNEKYEVIEEKVYKSPLDCCKESKIPREFLFFEYKYLDCVVSIGNTKILVSFIYEQIPEYIRNKVFEEIKR